MAKLPNVAVESYAAFVKRDVAATFDDVFPAWFPQGVSLECSNVVVGSPTHDLESCRLWERTYYSPIIADVTVSIFDPKDMDDDKAKPKSRKTERLVLGEAPAILPDGSFVVNGKPVVLMPTLDRSPGLLREYIAESETHQVKVVPDAGPWITLLKHSGDPVVYAQLNQNARKLVPVSTLLRALGMSDEDMFQLAEDIHGTEPLRILKSRRGLKHAVFRRKQHKWVQVEDATVYDMALVQDIDDVPAGAPLDELIIETIADQLGPGEYEEIRVMCSTSDQVNMATTAAADETTTKAQAQEVIGAAMSAGGRTAARTAFVNGKAEYSLSRAGRRHIQYATGAKSPDGLEAKTVDIALRELIRFTNTTRSDDTYSLENRRMVTVGDMMRRALIRGLGNWVEEVAKLAKAAVKNANKPGRKSKNDNRPKSLADLTPERLVSRKYITSAMRQLTGGDKAHRADQTNPVAEVMNRSRVVVEAGQSGPGSAAKSARWVGDSHFRRLSASESPEGKGIGLDNYLALHARPDRNGFLRVPAYKVMDGRVMRNEVDWLTYQDEMRAVVAYADSETEDGHLVGGVCKARMHVDGIVVACMVDVGSVTHMDVATDDALAVAGSLIPFVEHDDATRTIMASAHARQAVACIRNERPLVSTGRERHVADMASEGSVVRAAEPGEVLESDARSIIVAHDDGGMEYHRLDKPLHSGYKSFPRYRVKVAEGDRVEAGEVLADGQATRAGEVAIGQNIRVAYMSWRGFNFEDSIVISERLAAQDKLTSLHTRQLTCQVSMVRIDNKEVPEETTNINIPNVGESDLVRLDGDGIIHVGAVVKERDILVGKVTPKERKALDPMEQLQQLVFDKNLGSVKDGSLRMPPGYDGAVVVDVKVVTHKQGDDTLPPTQRELDDMDEFKSAMEDQLNVEHVVVTEQLMNMADGKRVVSMPGRRRGGTCRRVWLDKLPERRWNEIRFRDEDVHERFHAMLSALQASKSAAREQYKERIKGPDSVAGGSDVLRRIVVTIAYKRRIQPGDKLAGRHGNKGVVSRVVPVEDMPFDPKTGEPVDIILNPLGVPSRMNVGQLLEAHLGWGLGEIAEKLNRLKHAPAQRRRVAHDRLHRLGTKIGWRGVDTSSAEAMVEDIERNGITMRSPAFNGVREREIKQVLKLAGLPVTGQMRLCDGITGEHFDMPITVGYSYIYKLHHMVEDKAHARSRGRYVMHTSQPVGGRSKRGAQRIGEMEAWALMGYGAAHTLLEMTTLKSDDEYARDHIERLMADREVEASLPGSNLPDSLKAGVSLGEVLPSYTGNPAAWDLLVYELRAMALDLREELDGERVDAPNRMPVSSQRAGAEDDATEKLRRMLSETDPD